MRYIYLLQSERVEAQRYLGVTSDLKQRLAGHNAGKSPHTSKFIPWVGVIGLIRGQAPLNPLNERHGAGVAQW